MVLQSATENLLRVHRVDCRSGCPGRYGKLRIFRYNWERVHGYRRGFHQPSPVRFGNRRDDNLILTLQFKSSLQ